MTPKEAPEVLIAPERRAHILSPDLRTYTTRHERAAMRAALGDAATLCDALASEVIVQNTSRGRATKATRAAAATFTRAGDEIMRMRERVEVPR